MADALRPILKAPDTDSLTAILDALSDNAESMLQLAALSCDKPVEWVRGLTGTDGETLLMAFWVANRDFFMRRLMRAEIIRAALVAGGGGFLQLSSGTDTPAAN